MKPQKNKKITALLPEDLIKSAMEFTSAGITETIRTALELLQRKKAYEDLASLRCKFKITTPLETLRYDRDK